MWKLIMLETRANRFYANGSQYPDTSLPCVNTTDSPPEPYGNDTSTNVPWGTERCIVCSPVRFANLFSHSIHLGFGVTTSLFLRSFVPACLPACLPPSLPAYIIPMLPFCPLKCSIYLCMQEKPCLFEVISDPSETTNLAAANPTIVAKMAAQLETYQVRKRSF